jgi:hypothetical protein
VVEHMLNIHKTLGWISSTKIISPKEIYRNSSRKVINNYILYVWVCKCWTGNVVL